MKDKILHLISHSDLSPMMKMLANMAVMRMTEAEVGGAIDLFRRIVVSLNARDMDGLLSVLSDLGLNEKTIQDLADGITQK